jgi:hypothetical protein
MRFLSRVWHWVVDHPTTGEPDAVGHFLAAVFLTFGAVIGVAFLPSVFAFVTLFAVNHWQAFLWIGGSVLGMAVLGGIEERQTVKGKSLFLLLFLLGAQACGNSATGPDPKPKDTKPSIPVFQCDTVSPGVCVRN